MCLIKIREFEYLADYGNFLDENYKWVNYSEQSFNNPNDFKYWVCEEYDYLSAIGVIVKVWCNSRFTRHPSLSDIAKFSKSDIESNSIVNYCSWGTHINSIDTRDKFLRKSLILISLFEYGGGNCFYITIPIEDFLKIDFDEFNEHTKYNIRNLYGDKMYNIRYQILPKKYFTQKLSDIEKIEILNIYFKYKIKLKRYDAS